MKIDEFNQINEKLIRQLNEEADPLTNAMNADDIKNSLKIKADKKEDELKKSFYTMRSTDPSTKIGKLMRLNHSVKKVETEDAINAKRKYDISTKTGEHNKGIMEGLMDMAKDIDMDIHEETDNFFNDDITLSTQVDLREGLISKIKEAITKKKAAKANKKLDKVMQMKDDLESEIKKAQKEYDAASAKANFTNKESDKKKLDKLYDNIVDLNAKYQKIENQFNKYNDLVAGYEQKGYLEEEAAYESLLEAISDLKKDANDTVINARNLSDTKSDVAEITTELKNTVGKSDVNPVVANNHDLDVPDEMTQETGDESVDKMTSKIVEEINKEKTKEEPNILKIKKLIARLRKLKEK